MTPDQLAITVLTVLVTSMTIFLVYFLSKVHTELQKLKASLDYLLTKEFERSRKTPGEHRAVLPN